MLLQQIINGLALGMVYALVAVGFSLVFGILRLVNFSHSAVYAFGAHLTLLFIGLAFGPVPAVLMAVLITGVLGVVIDKVALAPLRKKQSIPIAGLITTIGISYVIQNVLTIVWGSGRRSFPQLFTFSSFELFGVMITAAQLLMFVISLVLMVVLTWLIGYTKIGLAMRSLEQNPKAAALMGIPVNRVITFTFFLAGATAAIAGALVSGLYHIIYPTMGAAIGIKAFSATVLGGVGSLPGAFVGGIVVGLSEAMAVTFLGAAYRDVISFVILILVLIIRPAGLFGRKIVVKV